MALKNINFHHSSIYALVSEHIVLEFVQSMPNLANKQAMCFAKLVCVHGAGPRDGHEKTLMVAEPSTYLMPRLPSGYPLKNSWKALLPTYKGVA
jgi:hypothetical protein